MICVNCGTMNPERALRCSYCGTRLRSSAPSPAFWVKLTLTILIPVLIYILMTRVLLKML